ncbi:uncharacterized protein LOC121417549 [Lytechinus variegatus]|uniref:uncharacterized protein LOC121417549 n=1 Tax=Lytechinus variegatus TaxID=7654 RepID=UPI001BB216C0|nr:uncharacterized protein LOC121417549 [Lytechinus variegatus]
MEKMKLNMMLFLIFTLISNSFLPATAVPSFDVEPRDVDVVEGGLATFWCTVADHGDANLYWRYVDGEGYYGTLSENEDTQTYAHLHGELTQRISIKGDFNHGVYNLFIKNVTMSDQKQYFCSAITQDFVSFDSRKARLTIQPRTRPEDPLHACSARAISPPNIFNVGSLVRFTCATPAGSPPQTLTWIFMENGIRTLLVGCPESPCIHNRLMSIDDVNRTFVCELRDSILNQVECTYTPLQRQVEVVVDPPLFQHPPGIRQGFICLPVNYDPNNLLFDWYHNSELIPNGTGHSFLNLMISRDDAGSTVSCVVSSLEGFFRGMAQARIEPFDPSELFPDVEGSSSPPHDQGTTRPTKTRIVSSKSQTVVKYTTISPSNEGGHLSIQPIGEISDHDTPPTNLSILVVVSAIAGALVAMLLCAIGLVMIIFVRKRRKHNMNIQYPEATQINGNRGQFEMGFVETKKMERCIEGEHNGTDPQRLSTCSDTVGNLDRFYVTLEPDENEVAKDVDESKKVGKESIEADELSAFGPPCTPNEYARPQSKPTVISDQFQDGIQGLPIHQRTMSASAYAVTDVVSHEGRFIFKGMSGRDEAHMGVCRLPSGERSATMSRAPTRNQTAPPLPARTLPRTVSVNDQTPSDVGQSDSGTTKENLKGKSKSSFGNRWPWSFKNTKHGAETPECSIDSEIALEIPEANSSENENRRLSLVSGGSGDYAEIISVDKDIDQNPNKRHSIACERLDSIPERIATGNNYQDVSAYSLSKAHMQNQPKIGKDLTTESGYDRLSRPNQVQESPLQRSRTMPIYAKVKKSKSLDNDGSRRATKETIHENKSQNRTEKSDPKLLRSMSEGTAPYRGNHKLKAIGGYDTVEITEKLDHILVQMRNGFTGETVDIPEEENKETNTNRGSHFADIV